MESSGDFRAVFYEGTLFRQGRKVLRVMGFEWTEFRNTVLVLATMRLRVGEFCGGGAWSGCVPAADRLSMRSI